MTLASALRFVRLPLHQMLERRSLCSPEPLDWFGGSPELLPGTWSGVGARDGLGAILSATVATPTPRITCEHVLAASMHACVQHSKRTHTRSSTACFTVPTERL